MILFVANFLLSRLLQLTIFRQKQLNQLMSKAQLLWLCLVFVIMQDDLPLSPLAKIFLNSSLPILLSSSPLSSSLLNDIQVF